MVIFRESDHSYHYNSEKYRSVSSLVEPFKTFDKEAESLRMACKHIDPDMYGALASKYGYKSGRIVMEMLDVYDREELDTVQKQILAEWGEKGLKSRTDGTAFHKQKESEDIAAGGRINPYTQIWTPLVNIRQEGYDNNSVDDLSKLEPGYYPELLLFNHEHKMCGQADMVFIDDERRVYIDDWKTDQKVDMKSFYTKRYGYTFLKAPLDHVHDTNYWLYAIKLSFYAFMLEEAGFSIAEVGFTHVGSEHLYRVPYMKDEVFKILTHE